uniref:RNA polymerase subunit alpha n=1 Tax=Andalucia godoyi TaxID=505711 RepID=M4Q9F0_ANDGO|nr:RNA polymerase subunit alpha [Andalucia godoyi]AGH23991.1 RNA polymerase subunit alpha [Andalucia godoyi]
MTFPFFRSQWKILSEDSRHLEAYITPVEKNFSLSFANLLRKTLFLSTLGYGITAVRIRGISSEFENIPGLMEDAFQIFTRFKDLSFLVKSNQSSYLLSLSIKGAKKVYAEDIFCPSEIQIVQKDHYLFTTNEHADLFLEFRLECGTGYVHRTDLGKHWIPIETNLNPIEHVSYKIHPYSHYEEVFFHIRTNGSIPARKALCDALKMFFEKSESMLISLNKSD